MDCGEAGGPNKTSPTTSSEQRERIKLVVTTSKVFSYVAQDRVDNVVEAFRGPLFVPKGTTVIEQGACVTDGQPGLFLIESGSLDVLCAKTSGGTKPSTKVFTLDRPGQVFGHLALLYDCPRTATVVANSDAVLWHIDRQHFTENQDMGQFAQVVAQHTDKLNKIGIPAKSMSDVYGIYEVNLTDEPDRWKYLANYYSLCRDSSDLMCTLSCFSVWNQHKKTNGYAKVIPAVRASSQDNVRIFFFDDNLEFAGKEESPGICNLRDVLTGQFVTFSEGVNGFSCDRTGGRTTVFHSSEYRNVLVQANILDAMEDEGYFTEIIARYTKPGERIIAFLDVNSTIIGVDTVSGKDCSQVLLSTMLEYINLEPRESFELPWDGRDPVKVDKHMSFKQLVKKIAQDDKKYYASFYSYDNCYAILSAVSALADVRWTRHDKDFSMRAFQDEFEHYLVSLVGSTSKEGITRSWFRCFNTLNADGHSLVLNSFGLDTRKVIVKSVVDERQVMQILVSFKHWDAKDRTAFSKVYGLSIDDTA